MIKKIQLQKNQKNVSAIYIDQQNCPKNSFALRSFRLVSVLILLTPILVFGQSDKSNLITIRVENTTIDSVVASIEQQTHYRFYYRASDFEEFRITLNIVEQSITVVLNELFSNTKYYYVVDSEHNIFFTKDIVINTRSHVADSEDIILRSGENKIVANEDFARKIIALNERRIFEIGESKLSTAKATLTGIVKDVISGEPIAGAAIVIANTVYGTSSDEKGRYFLEIPSGKHEVIVRSIGHKSTKRSIIMYSDGNLNIDMIAEESQLDEIVITSERDAHIKSLQMGVDKLDIQTIKYIPSSFGEVDVLKAILTLPGVKTVGEASSGFNIRGGAADQNLILFNNSTVYNPFHFFGFFSSFNAESVEDVELFKSSIPAMYGGRLSSVLKISGREGDMTKIKGSAGIGLLTSRINLEGPILKDKISFLAGARTTYSNWLFAFVPESSGFKDSRASFHDVNLTLTGKVNKENTVSVSGYLSNDESNLNTDTLYSYGNKNISLSWKREFNSNLFGEFIIGQDHYGYGSKSSTDPINAYQLTFALNQTNLKINFDYELGNKHNLQFGLNSIYYAINPGTYNPIGSQSLVQRDIVEPEQGIESALFIEDQFSITEDFSFSAGLRYSIFNYLGKQTVNKYASGLPRTEDNKLEEIHYKNNELINTYHGPEFRLSVRYAITENFSVKASYNTLYQYLHMLSNTVAISPTDTWKLSDPNIKPQFSEQYSIGLYNRLFKEIETSVEVYKKNITNYLDYKSGASLIMNDHVETEVMTTKGNAYGAEFMIKKPTGKLNGWISYTYSRILLKMDDPIAGENINKGEYYPASYDKPHDFNFTLNQKITRRLSFSFNTNYSTGRPVTIPIGVFYYGGSPKTLYSDRNGYRIPDYFRMDFSANIEGNHKVKQWIHTSWTIGVYNLTGRKNPYSVYYTSENGVINGYKLSILGTMIPFINFNFKF